VDATERGVMTMTDSPLATADWSGMVVCTTWCYACQFGQHPDVPHTWGAPDDFEHAWATFQQAPGFCGCSCGKPPRTPPKMKVRCRTLPPIGPFVIRFWSWTCPRCSTATSYDQAAAVVDALKHRGSDGCKWRGLTA
jgi:hypothetical protein